MGTLVNLGSEPPKKPGADKAPRSEKKGDAAAALSNISLTPQTIGIGAGVVAVLAVLLWFAFGRGSGEAAATGAAGGNAALPGSTAGAYPSGGANPSSGGGVSTTAAYPSGGSGTPSPGGMDTSTSAVPGGFAPGGAVPPPTNMSSGYGDGGSVTTTGAASTSISPNVGSPVMMNADGTSSPAGKESPFRKLPNGQVIDLRDPPGNR